MTVTTGKRTTIITDSKGQKVMMEPTDVVENRTPVKMVCDGPKRASRNNTAVPVTVEWVQEEAQAAPEIMPEAFFKFIRVGINPLQPVELSFCSAACTKDYLTYVYKTPATYQEQMETLEKEAQVGDISDAIARQVHV